MQRKFYTLKPWNSNFIFQHFYSEYTYVFFKYSDYKHMYLYVKESNSKSSTRSRIVTTYIASLHFMAPNHLDV